MLLPRLMTHVIRAARSLKKILFSKLEQVATRNFQIVLSEPGYKYTRCLIIINHFHIFIRRLNV